MYEHPRPGRQKTIALPFILSFIASMSQLGVFALGAAAFTVNPFAINFKFLQFNYTVILCICQEKYPKSVGIAILKETEIRGVSSVCGLTPCIKSLGNINRSPAVHL